jgi:hypothetical protein
LPERVYQDFLKTSIKPLEKKGTVMANVKELHLYWAGPFGWTRQNKNCFFDFDISNEQGVYLWTVNFDSNSFLTYYVGETGRTFAKRFQEHTKEYMSGVYRIYDPDKFSKGIKELIWGGLWQKDREHLWPDFIEKFSELAPMIYKLLTCFHLFFAPIQVETTIRKRIEASVGKTLKNTNETTKAFFDDTAVFRIRKDSEPLIHIINHTDSKIIGMKKVIKA